MPRPAKPDERLARLRRLVAEFPRTSGVYIMKDASGREIYVGKAKDLRARVRQYFDAGRLDGKTSALMNQAAEIETLDTPSEVEALLLESRLIKDLQPKYNVSLKGTSYPLVEVTWGESFPRVMITRDRSNRASHYHGPFVDATGLRAALALLRRVFRFCTAPGAVEEHPRRPVRPCLDHHVGLCSGACAGLVPRDEYRAMIRRFEELLEGRGRARVEAEIRNRMEAAARELRFEEAARLRDELRAVESLALRGGLDSPQPPEMPRFDPAEALAELARVLELPAPPARIEGLDLANLSGREGAGSIVTFLDGRPAKGFYRRYRIKAAPTDDDYAMMREVVGRRCRRLAEQPAFGHRLSAIGTAVVPKAESRKPKAPRHAEVAGGPDLLLLDGGAGHLAAALEALKRGPAAGRPKAVCALSKGDETIHLPDGGALHLPRTNPGLKLLQHIRDEAHRFAGQYHRKLRDKALLPEDP
ncbi:MAG TPA: GIY-YIG nuclease family protein [Planctomycetota bacterium]|nr:GIY-YIG nuclease family protein [Planctomycetota bacterium]